MTTPIIRSATYEDAQSLAALSIQVWLDTYAVEGLRQEYAEYALSTFTQAYFTSLLQREEISIYVAVHQGAIQGYVQANNHSKYHQQDLGFEVEKLYVLSRFQGLGIGRRLLSHMVEKLGERYWLYTWVENKSNRFYEKLGLKLIGKHHFQFHHWEIENNVYHAPGKVPLGINQTEP
ncbi:N-acetyltransferase [Pseudoalteromonas piscicida]|uniref:GNAT family N-acetyltransferase n=1 Tax=Pseudoalteromonas piscicida TaxID=43662 RepID=UPI0030B17156